MRHPIIQSAATALAVHPRRLLLVALACAALATLGLGREQAVAGFSPPTAEEAASGEVAPDFDAACQVKAITRAPEGLKVWSPDGQRYIINKKDARGVYQLYVGH